MFRALDDRTGETLWEMLLNTIPSASPITYSVGGPHDSQSWQMTPEIENSAASTTLSVFAWAKPPQ
jgi:hypothetical protein